MEAVRHMQMQRQHGVQSAQQPTQPQAGASRQRQFPQPQNSRIRFHQLMADTQRKVNNHTFFYPPSVVEEMRKAEDWLSEAKARFGQALQRLQVAETRKEEYQRQAQQRLAAGSPLTPLMMDIFNAKLAQCDRAMSMDNDDQYANWNRFFDAFSAAAILAIACLYRENKLVSDVSIIMTFSSHLQAILSRNPHFRLATVAAGRIGQLLDDIEKDVAAPANEQQLKAQQPKPSESESKRVHSESELFTAKPQGELSMKKSKPGNTEASSTSGTKRRKRDPVSPKQEKPYGEVRGTSMIYAQSSQDMGTEGALQGHDSAGYVTFADNPGSTTTSFDTSISVAHYPPYGTYSDQIAMNNATGTSWYWLHPPVAQLPPPFRNFDEWPLPAYTRNDDWQHLTVSHYQSNVIPEQAVQVGGSYEPGPFYDRSSISISVPPTTLQQQPSGTNQSYADPPPSLSQAQIAAGTTQADYIAQSAAQGENPGDWFSINNA